jgi:hypothetical protein
MSGATGRAVLTVAGQVIGAYFGPIGSAIGGAIGGALGNALFPLDPVEGPRMQDLKVQQSAYGLGIPLLYGSVRTAGNVFWASAIRETRTEEDVDGKGGPSQTVVSYSYDVDLAVGLCSTECVGVRRIWANGRLIYDVVAGQSPAAVAADGRYLDRLAFYPGSETQQPDPTIEAARGVGSTPAYRGMCYVVLSGLQLNEFGSVIPNLEFEVVQSGAASFPARKLSATITPGYVRAEEPGAPLCIITGAETVVRVMSGADGSMRIYDYAGALLSTERRNESDVRFPVPQWDELPGGYREMWPARSGGRFWVQTLAGGEIDVQVVVAQVVIARVTDAIPAGRQLISATVCVDQEHVLLLHRAPGETAATAWQLVRWDGSSTAVIRSGTVDTTTAIAEPGVRWGAPWATPALFRSSIMESNLTHLWVAYGAGLLTVTSFVIGADNVLRRDQEFIGAGALLPGGTFMYPAIYADRGLAAVVSGNALQAYSRLAELTPAPAGLGSIAANLCTRAGYSLAEIDTTALTPAVDGFILGGGGTGRSGLEALQRAYWFDAVESGAVLRFVMRGGAPVATITAADLGAAEGRLAGAVRLETDRAQETELPARATVRYFARDADQQQGAQGARRATAASRAALEVTLPLVLSDARAAQAADILLYEAWASRSRRRFSLTAAWSRLEATDVVLLGDGALTYRLRIEQKSQAGNRIDFTAVDDLADVYVPNAAFAAITATQQVPVLPPTRLEAMDLPALRDVDDEPGVYVAAAGYGPAWTGARTYTNEGEGTAWQSRQTIDKAAVIGTAITVLATSGRPPGLPDEANTVRVTVASGTLASVSYAQFLAGANAALLGDELIYFREAALVAAGVYDLRGFLRGRKGTERFMGTHAAFERFVLLSSGTARWLDLPLAARGLNVGVRALTLGQQASQATVQTVPFTAATLLPYAPVQVRALRQGSDVLIRWVRRGRLANGWNNGADVPLSEASEAYDVEILNAPGTAVLRTLSAVTPQVTYTAAQQAADGLANAIALNLRVYQLSARVGRGVAAAGSVPVVERQIVPPALARFWRLSISAVNGGARAVICEMRLLLDGANQFTGGTASASSELFPGFAYLASEAFDGELVVGGWSTDNGLAAPSWLQYELAAGVQRTGQYLQITLGGSTAHGGSLSTTVRDFALQRSNDGVSWETVKGWSGVTWAAYNETQLFALE